jgi:predicted RecB family nuclease
VSGYDLRLAYREADFLQLAHYVRMLEAAGHDASGPSWGGVVGTDEVPEVAPAHGAGGHEVTQARKPSPGDRFIVWADLGEPSVRSFSSSDPRGWQLRSLLDRYDDEHRFRIAIAQSARHQTGNPGVDPPLLVNPIVNRECASCPWWQVCRPQLDDDDLSLRLERGPLGAREIIALRAAGIVTVHQLAAADLDELLAAYLPEVSHCAGAERRLRTAARRARMLEAGTAFERETSGPIEVPAADLEIDFDLETAGDGRIYLWGFRVQSATSQPYVRQFCRFAELDDDTEVELAREALDWLRGSVFQIAGKGGSEGALVYHYSGFEVAMLEALAARSGDPLLRWGAELAKGPGFVDMLEVVKPHYFGVAGLGLKSIAQHAGFRWRDADPGGLNSQRWFDEAVHGDADRRALARRRVLEYNEDDVIATGWLREWLRAQ